MKTLWVRLMRKFGFYPEPITLAGIYGVTEDGCYIVMGEDGVIRKSHPLDPQSAAETADPYVMSLRRISGHGPFDTIRTSSR